MCPVREQATIHAPVEQAKMEAKLRALERQGKLELTRDKNTRKVESVSVAPRVSSKARVSTSPPPQPGTVEKMLTTRGPVGSVLGGSVLYNEVRGAASAVNLAAKHDHLLDKHQPELFHAGAVPDAISAGAAAVSSLTNGLSVVSNSLKTHQTRKKKKEHAQTAVANAEEGFKFLSTGGKEGSGSALLKFNKATQPILVTRHGRTAIELEQQVYGSNIGRYLANTVSSLSSFASYVAKAAGTVLSGVGQVSGAGGIVGGIGEVSASIAQHHKASWELKTTERRQAGLEQRSAELAGSSLETALHNAECKEQARREKLARRTKVNAKVGVLKGSVSIVAGIALIVVGSIATVATAGLWLAVAAGVATGCLAAWGLRHAWREGKVARHAKRRQRQAQALMATHSQKELEAMISKTAAQDRKCKVVTVERKHLLSREKIARTRTVDIGQNGYLAMEIRSRRLAARLDPGQLKWDDDTRRMISKILENPPDSVALNKLGPESASALRLLKFVGMQDTEILALCHSALQEPNPAKRSALLRPHMAHAQGLPWVAEKPLPVASKAKSSPPNSGIVRPPKPFNPYAAKPKPSPAAGKAKSGASPDVALTSSKDELESSNVELNSSLPTLKSETATSETLTSTSETRSTVSR